MNQCTDDLTRSLFARLRRTPRNNVMEPESLLLKCPKCGSRLRPLLLDMFEERGVNFQKIWWTCRNLKNKTCIFPLNMPPDVFWTKRNEEQIRHNVIPLPNYNLLPDELKYLYPFLKNKKVLVSKPRSTTTTSKQPTSSSKGTGSDPSTTEKAAAIQNDDDVIERPQPAKTPEDEILQKIPSPKNKEENFEEFQELEKEKRNSRKRKNKSEGPIWGKKQLRGVVSNSTVNGRTSAATFSSIRDMKRMKPAQERKVTGGLNFNYNIVDESVPSSSSAVNRIQLFPDIQSSLKSALAIRFARKDYMDKVNTLFGDTGTASNRNEDIVVEKRKLLARISEQFPVPPETKEINSPRSSSQEEDNNGNGEDGSETASSRGSDKTTESTINEALYKATSKAFNAFRDVEQKISLSSRLGIRLTEKPSVRVKSEQSLEPPNELYAPLSVQSGLENDISNPSTSNLSVDSSNQINPPVQEKISTNFDSPELHNIVQKHLLLLRSKAGKKKKKRRVENALEEETPSRSPHPYGQESQEPLFDFGMQDEQDYGIFSLGDDDSYGYDVFNF